MKNVFGMPQQFNTNCIQNQLNKKRKWGKRSGLQNMKIISHQGVACLLARLTKLNELKYKLLEYHHHHQYSPDFAPTDYYLFRYLEEFFLGNKDSVKSLEMV